MYAQCGNKVLCFPPFDGRYDRFDSKFLMVRWYEIPTALLCFLRFVIITTSVALNIVIITLNGSLLSPLVAFSYFSIVRLVLLFLFFDILRGPAFWNFPARRPNKATGGSYSNLGHRNLFGSIRLYQIT